MRLVKVVLSVLLRLQMQITSMYREVKTFDGSTLIFRESDSAWIPFDPDNADYQEYLRWAEAGDAPETAE